MQPLPITFIPSEGQVNITRVYGCEFCHDTGKVEGIDLETGYGTGYFRKCEECREDDHDPDANY